MINLNPVNGGVVVTAGAFATVVTQGNGKTSLRASSLSGARAKFQTTGMGEGGGTTEARLGFALTGNGVANQSIKFFQYDANGSDFWAVKAAFGSADAMAVSVERSVGGIVTEPAPPVVAVPAGISGMTAGMPPASEYEIHLGLVVSGGVTHVRVMFRVSFGWLSRAGVWDSIRDCFDFTDATSPTIAGPGVLGVEVAGSSLPEAEIYRLEADAQGPTNATMGAANPMLVVGSNVVYLYPVQFKAETVVSGDQTFAPVVLSGVSCVFDPPTVTIPAATRWGGFTVTPLAAGTARIGITSSFVTIKPFDIIAVDP